MFCPKCGKELVSDARFCIKCGTDIQKALGFSKEDTQASGTTDTSKAESAMPGGIASENRSLKVLEVEGPGNKKGSDGWHDAEAVVGKNQEYYRSEFQKVTAGEKTRFNWAAFIFGPVFCFYRRCGELFKKFFLGSSILLTFGCLAETAGIRRLDSAMTFSGAIILAVGLILQIINMIRFGCQFNQAYYKHCQNSALELPEQTGTSVKSAVCFCAVCVLIALAVSKVSTWVDDLVGCVGWAVIMFLAWIFIKPYIMTLRLSKKNRAGIRTSLTADQLMKLIENNPWCESQIIREYATEIPGTQVQSQLNFVGVRSEVYFRIESGILHAYGFTAAKVEKFRRLYLVHAETRKLLQYISALERQDLEMAEQLKRDNISAIKLRSGYDTFDKSCWIIAAVAIVVLPVFFKVSGIGRTQDEQDTVLPPDISMNVIQAMPTPEPVFPEMMPTAPGYDDSYNEAPGIGAVGTGALDNFVGSWQDESGYGSYLLIGYADESKSQGYVWVVTAYGEFEAELNSDSEETATGVVMGGGSVPAYGIDLYRDQYRLDASIYYGEYGFSEDVTFVPADPATSLYANPYYTG